MENRPANAIDCDCCGGQKRYPIYSAGGSLRLWITCPACEGAGHDYGDAAEDAAELAQQNADRALRTKYEAVMFEMRNGAPAQREPRP